MKASGDRVIARDREIGKTSNLCHPERHRATQERGKVEGPREGFLRYTASGSSYDNDAGLLCRLRDAWNIIRAVFREIFDESAYDRFLQRTRASHSVESYRAFMRERESVIARKPRCC